MSRSVALRFWLLLVGSGCLLANAAASADFGRGERVGNWWRSNIEINEQAAPAISGGAFAVTVGEEENGIFGFWCTLADGRCLWGLLLPYPCAKDSWLPILINAENLRTRDYQLHCLGRFGPENTYRYAIVPQDGFDAALRAAPNIATLAFVIPNAADFVVERFPMTGALIAVAVVQAQIKHQLGRATAFYALPSGDRR